MITHATVDQLFKLRFLKQLLGLEKYFRGSRLDLEGFRFRIWGIAIHTAREVGSSNAKHRASEISLTRGKPGEIVLHWPWLQRVRVSL